MANYRITKRSRPANGQVASIISKALSSNPVTPLIHKDKNDIQAKPNECGAVSAQSHVIIQTKLALSSIDSILTT